MRWSVAFAMGLMAWGAYALTRPRPSPPGLALGRAVPENGNSRRNHSALTPSTTETSRRDRSLAATAQDAGRDRSVVATAQDTGSIPLIRVTWTVRAPAGTPGTDFIYICGNHAALGHWNPMGVALLPVAPCLYRGELRMPAGTRFEYKFTRGTWASVEVRKGGAHRPNRILDLDHSAALESEIEAWADRT